MAEDKTVINQEITLSLWTAVPACGVIGAVMVCGVLAMFGAARHADSSGFFDTVSTVVRGFVYAVLAAWTLLGGVWIMNKVSRWWTTHNGWREMLWR